MTCYNFPAVFHSTNISWVPVNARLKLQTPHPRIFWPSSYLCIALCTSLEAFPYICQWDCWIWVWEFLFPEWCPYTAMPSENPRKAMTLSPRKRVLRILSFGSDRKLNPDWLREFTDPHNWKHQKVGLPSGIAWHRASVSLTEPRLLFSLSLSSSYSILSQDLPEWSQDAWVIRTLNSPNLVRYKHGIVLCFIQLFNMCTDESPFSFLNDTTDRFLVTLEH